MKTITINVEAKVESDTVTPDGIRVIVFAWRVPLTDRPRTTELRSVATSSDDTIEHLARSAIAYDLAYPPPDEV